MRLGMFFGSAKRNDNYLLEDPRPIARQPDTVCSGNAGLDGFSILAKASEDNPGNRPSVQGTIGPTHRGPSMSFEN